MAARHKRRDRPALVGVLTSVTALSSLALACSTGGETGPVFPSTISGPGASATESDTSGDAPDPVDDDASSDESGFGTSTTGSSTGTTGPPVEVTTGATMATTAAESSSGTPDEFPADGRVYEGIVALYRFDEGGGAVVRDQSMAEPLVDLAIPGGAPVSWLAGGGVQFSSSATVGTNVGATKIGAACRASSTLTVEAWVTPARLETEVLGPARIVSYSNGSSLRNFTLGQIDAQFAVRLRTSTTDENGLFNEEDVIGGGAATTSLTHLVLTYSNPNAQLFVNGALATTTAVGGNLAGWADGYRLFVGNESTGAREWLGNVYLVAVYCRALSAAEIGQNFAAGI